MQDDDEIEEEGDEDEVGKCTKCLVRCKKVTAFLLSHVGLISLVVGYCIMGAFTFEALESSHELEVKKNMTKVRQAVSQFLWKMTQNANVIITDDWLRNTTIRLQEFESELWRAMKKGGWDGSESLATQQWTFSGALFYSIVVITTIGYGHICPKTASGKVVTIFYAILGIPLMLLCLSHIGDFMAKAFRFLYWKVCCYFCTRKPRSMRRHGAGGPGGTFRRGRSVRSNPVSRQISSGGGSRGMKRSASAIRRSVRTSQRSADSDYSSSAISTSFHDHGIRRVHSEEQLQLHHPKIKMKSMMRDASPPIQQQPRFHTLQHPKKNATRFAAQMVEPRDFELGLKQNILCNKYAEDEVVIDDESQVRRGSGPNSYRVRMRQIKASAEPSSSAYASSSHNYWEEEAGVDFIAEDYYGSSEDEMNDNIRKRPVPIWLCVLLVLTYILSGAFLFSGWEKWNFLDSAYFCFVTLTTIGFGDFVPAQRVLHSEQAQVSIALCSLYLLFGISLLAMSFNLVQEEVISNVKLVATRLGIIREEED